VYGDLAAREAQFLRGVRLDIFQRYSELSLRSLPTDAEALSAALPYRWTT